MDSRIIIGAGGTAQEGWTSLEKDDLDIRDPNAWLRLFPSDSLSSVLSEHVLEHLDASEAEHTALNIFRMLQPGGYWRIAVPDSNNPDPKYREHSRPNGPGQQRMAMWYGSEPGHKVFYNLQTLSLLLQGVGFKVVPREWFDDRGVFHRNDWRRSDGTIKRSYGSPYLLLNYLWVDCWNLSLIVDAVK